MIIQGLYILYSPLKVHQCGKQLPGCSTGALYIIVVRTPVPSLELAYSSSPVLLFSETPLRCHLSPLQVLLGLPVADKKVLSRTLRSSCPALTDPSFEALHERAAVPVVGLVVPQLLDLLDAQLPKPLGYLLNG